MNLRHFENKARQSFWLVHIEAWRRSGLDRTNYCRQHRLTKCTFDRWLKYLAGKDAARKQAEYQAELRRRKKLEARETDQKKRIRQRFSVSTDARSRAVQAFWAMHVEAMNWSGMGVREYAAAMQLSPTSLRKWRDRLDELEDSIDWRAHLHPSARPVAGTSARKMLPARPVVSTSAVSPTPENRKRGLSAHLLPATQIAIVATSLTRGGCDGATQAERSASAGFLVTACGCLDAQSIQSTRVLRAPRYIAAVAAEVADLAQRRPCPRGADQDRPVPTSPADKSCDLRWR